MTFVGIAHGGDSGCEDTNSTDTVSVHSLLASDKICTDTSPIGDNTSQSHDICHSCHLGHCAFPLLNNLAILSYSDSEKFLFDVNKVVLSDFHSSLFRPPIS